MKNLIAFLDRHPYLGVLALIALFGLVGTLDLTEQERAEAYDTGYINGQRSAYVAKLDPDAQRQLDTLCAQQWPEGTELARKRTCKSS